jgi:glycosyltransferase involved in cell wall biosynthesis
VAGVGFLRDLRRLGINQVHCHFNSSTDMAWAAHMVGGVPFSFTVHANPDLFIRPTLLQEKVASARFVVAVCEYNRQLLNALTGFRHSAKLHRIHNGIERLEARQDPASRPSIQRGVPEQRILAVGSLVTMKGHATLIQACATLRERGRSFRCRIIGEGPERATLERLIRSHALEDHVELAGARSLDEVYAALSEADVFALLSEIGPCGYRDSFPTVILEAMAAGRPVVSTSLSGIPEMVVDGVTGLLVRERDVAAAARALECLLESEQLRRSMGEKGRARVHELFDLEQSADQLAALLAEDRTHQAASTARQMQAR